MRNRNRMIATAAVVAAVLAAGSGAAVAATSGGKPGAPAPAVSVSKTPNGSPAPGGVKPPGPADNGDQTAFVAAVAAELNLSTAQVSAALQPLFAATSPEDTSSLIAAAASSLGVSPQQLAGALVQAKQSLRPGT
jgi:hypothetical protein